MSAPVAPPPISPLTTLTPSERRTAIATLSASLPQDEAVALLTALSGRVEEVWALPIEARRHAQEVLLDAFPDGINVVVLSSLGLAALEPAGDWVNRVRERLERLDSMDSALDVVRAWRHDGA